MRTCRPLRCLFYWKSKGEESYDTHFSHCNFYNPLCHISHVNNLSHEKTDKILKRIFKIKVEIVFFRPVGMLLKFMNLWITLEMQNLLWNSTNENYYIITFQHWYKFRLRECFSHQWNIFHLSTSLSTRTGSFLFSHNYNEDEIKVILVKGEGESRDGSLGVNFHPGMGLPTAQISHAVAGPSLIILPPGSLRLSDLKT